MVPRAVRSRVDQCLEIATRDRFGCAAGARQSEGDVGMPDLIGSMLDAKSAIPKQEQTALGCIARRELRDCNYLPSMFWASGRDSTAGGARRYAGRPGDDPRTCGAQLSDAIWKG